MLIRKGTELEQFLIQKFGAFHQKNIEKWIHYLFSKENF